MAREFPKRSVATCDRGSAIMAAGRRLRNAEDPRAKTRGASRRSYDQRTTGAGLSRSPPLRHIDARKSAAASARGRNRCPRRSTTFPPNGRSALGSTKPVRGNVRPLDHGPARVLGRARQAHRLVQALHEGQGHLLRHPSRRDQMVRGRRHQRRLQLHRSPPGQARQSDRDHLGRRRSQPRQAHHLRRAVRSGLPFRQRAEVARRQEGRSRHDLSADDPRDGLCDARLRAHRRDPLGRVRRLLARRARGPHRGRQVGGRDHGGRRLARRAQGAAQGQRRHRD